MRMPASLRRKSTPGLQERLQQAKRDDRLEVIVRVMDPEAERGAAEALGPSARTSERDRMCRLLDHLSGAIEALRVHGEPVQLIDTSWLAQSVLVSADPASLAKLAGRDDVAMLDINAEVERVESGGLLATG